MMAEWNMRWQKQQLRAHVANHKQKGQRIYLKWCISLHSQNPPLETYLQQVHTS